MILREEEIGRIEEAFKELYRKDKKVAVSAAWDDRVMRAVRRIGVDPSRRSGDLDGFGPLVWRLTAATSLLALLLVVYSVTSEPGAASEVTRLFFEDPLGMELAHALGIV